MNNLLRLRAYRIPRAVKLIALYAVMNGLTIGGGVWLSLATHPDPPRVVSVCNTRLATACSCVGTEMRWRSADVVECVEKGAK